MIRSVNPLINGARLIPSCLGPVTWVGWKERSFQSSVDLDVDPDCASGSCMLQDTILNIPELQLSHRGDGAGSEESCAEGGVRSLAQQAFLPAAPPLHQRHLSGAPAAPAHRAQLAKTLGGKPL